MRAGVDPKNVDRALEAIDTEVRQLGAERPDACRGRRNARIPDRVDPAAARDQLQHRQLPADVRAVRPGARLRSAPPGAPRSGDDRRDPIRGGRSAEPRARRGRCRRARRSPRSGRAVTAPAVQSATRAVFFDVDFTLIYPGPAFQGGGYRDFCARHGVEVDPERVRSRRRRRRPPCSIRAATSTTTTRRSTSTTRGGSSKAWAAPDRGSKPRHATSTPNGPPATISRCTTTFPACCARCTPRA